ncbi:MAG: hypothetical protein MHM6MM_003275 [Cercozoa sp. M6MM]
MEPEPTFSSLEELVRRRGGRRVLRRVLIANNGLAAVKFIRSVRQWCATAVGNAHAVTLVCMASADDVAANAEFVRLADERVPVPVPGGASAKNYGNVSLIASLALRAKCDAVWPGWGHASENPRLPALLARIGVTWLGPPPAAMQALGDKVASTVLAQSADVPCVAWSGQHVTLSSQQLSTLKQHTSAASDTLNPENLLSVLSEETRVESGVPLSLQRQCCVITAQEAELAARQVGLPVMVKASEGGGGKGIRLVSSMDDLPAAFRQVQTEVPGSPIFLMRVARNCRHLEVQLLADEQGTCIALSGRDCSIQRRHQKIIEEGPPLPAKDAPNDTIWRRMESAAVRLAEAVGYSSAGTVEYLYEPETKNFYFLELNPRLQVEHPVTELLTGINLPAAQLQVGMGIPLSGIAHVRRYFGHKMADTGVVDLSSDEAYSKAQYAPDVRHVLACRITAENPDDQFRPTSGLVEELVFRGDRHIDAYFAVKSKSLIHDYADSQFGHVFATGATREEARKRMLNALSTLSVRGAVRCNADFLRRVLRADDFVRDQVSTSWLETAVANGSIPPRETLSSETRLEDPVVALLGGIWEATRVWRQRRSAYVGALARGRVLFTESDHDDLVQHDVSLVLNSVRFELSLSQAAPDHVVITHKDWVASASVTALSDGALLVSFQGMSASFEIFGRTDPGLGLRLLVGGVTYQFVEENDPSTLRAAMPGKLVRFLVRDGEHVSEGEAVAELEVMKMVVPLVSTHAGVVAYLPGVAEGCVLQAGDQVASLALDDDRCLSQAEEFDGSMPEKLDARQHTAQGNSWQRMVAARSALKWALSGFALPPTLARQACGHLVSALRGPLLPAEAVAQVLADLRNKLPIDFVQTLQGLLRNFVAAASQDRFVWEEPRLFPTLEVNKEIDSLLQQNPELANTVAPLTEVLATLGDGRHNRRVAVSTIRELLEMFTQTEAKFAGRRVEVVLNQMRRDHIGKKATEQDAKDWATDVTNSHFVPVMRDALAHFHLNARVDIVLLLLEQVRTALRPLRADFDGALNRLLVLQGMGYDRINLWTRQMLMHTTRDGREARDRRVEVRAMLAARSLQPLVNDASRLDDVLFGYILAPQVAHLPKHIREAALEVYARRVYRAHNIEMHSTQGDILPALESVDTRCFFTFRHNALRHHDADCEDTTLERMAGMAFFGDFATLKRELAGFVDQVSLHAPSSVSTPTPSLSLNPMSPSMSRASSTASLSSCGSGATASLHLAFRFDAAQAALPSDDTFAESFAVLLRPHLAKLDALKVRNVTFYAAPACTSNDEDALMRVDTPLIFTFRKRLHWQEDSIIRHLEPTSALHLEIDRLRRFDVRLVSTGNTKKRPVHVLAAVPRKPLTKGRTSWDGRRFFARCLVRHASSVQRHQGVPSERLPIDAFPEAEHAFVEALNEIEHASALHHETRWRHNAVMLNLLLEVPVDARFVRRVIRALTVRHADSIQRLDIAQVEIRVLLPQQNEAAVPYRFVCWAPTRHVLQVDVYREVYDESQKQLVFRSVPPQQDMDGADAGDLMMRLARFDTGPLDGRPVTSAYPVKGEFFLSRLLAQSVGTVYAYDLLVILEKALRLTWAKHLQKVVATEEEALDIMPNDMMSIKEIVLSHADKVDSDFLSEDKLRDQIRGALPGSSWQDRVDAALGVLGDITLVEREAGQNDVGMVAWLLTLKTPECPDGRPMVLIANDIAHQMGTFGVQEDLLFHRASQLARGIGAPRLFVTANSGARIGLADEVLQCVKVAWKVPMQTVDYLYVSPEDFESKQLQASLQVEPVPGQERLRITSVVGARDGLGVENLSGSGLIAAETARAYDDVVTLSFVSGRAVGIGAYLVRLGQRVVQKSSAPIILTGFGALNKLLGSKVYSSNMQLGGPDIMMPNGVSHLQVRDDLSGMYACLRWLAMVPPVNTPLPGHGPHSWLLRRLSDGRVRRFFALDAADRQLRDPFVGQESGERDPRSLLRELCDAGSFLEVQHEWAKSVVVGRARLGGVPIGLVCAETRLTESVVPADPAAPDDTQQEQVLQRAGQVWFPDSAHKTAQFIADVDREKLPLFIVANWRGFSGGQRDMYAEVLKFGALIVDALRRYSQPVFVYVPPLGELRGGAWAVLDSSINARMMEMYASPQARGGVLEPEGTIGIKLRKPKLKAMAHRLDDK